MNKFIKTSAAIEGQIDILLAAIKKNTGIEKVILFGSCTRALSAEVNDIDILIITKDDVYNSENLVAQIRKDTFTTIHMPVDILVETKSTYEDRKKLPTLERLIDREGVILYAA